MEDREIGPSAELNIDDYIAFLKSSSPFTEASERPRSHAPAASIEDAFYLVGDIVRRQLQLEGDKTNLIYTEEYPDTEENLDSEMIVFGLKSRFPGAAEQVGVDRAMSGRAITRSRRAKYRQHYSDPENPGLVIVERGRMFDNEVFFKIMAKTNKIANRRALWFESLIDRYRWLLQANGVNRIEYLRRESDAIFSPGKTKIVVRPLFYLIRTERVEVIKEFELRSIVLQSSLDRSHE